MGTHFDEFAKALASGVSRRQAFKKLGRGLLGAALASTIPGLASANPQAPPVVLPCPPGLIDCNGKCCPSGQCVSLNGQPICVNTHIPFQINGIFINGFTI